MIGRHWFSYRIQILLSSSMRVAHFWRWFCLLAILASCEPVPSHGRLPNACIKAHALDSLLQTATHVTIVDIRPEADYRLAHLPGAVNIWRPALAAEGFAYSSLTASKEKLEREFGKLGIASDQLLVVYDGQMSADAANLRWIMRLHGKRDVQILQGGIQGWMAGHYPTDTGIVRRSPTPFQFIGRPDSSYYATLQDVQSAVGDPGSLIVDTRTFEEFTGAKIKEGAKRGGHIPGSIWLNYSDATMDTLGCTHLLNRAKLEALFVGKGITKDKKIICYTSRHRNL
jgi:thiosulfate/3-mercaptopyruvate sulfurtransferase